MTTTDSQPAPRGGVLEDAAPVPPGPEPAGDEESAGAGPRSLDRPFAVLRVLRESRRPLRLTEISQGSGLHLATTQRLVNLLMKHGYVERDGADYRLGLVSLINGYTYQRTSSLVQVAEPVLREITDATRLTSMLAVRRDLTQVRILRILGTPPPRYLAEVGEQVSLVVGGARVFAAALSAPDLDRLLEGVESIPLASGRVIDRQEFVEGLRAIRERGYAFGQGQGEGGSVSIAVPVVDRSGEVIASLQVTGLIEDIPIDVETLVVELQRASAAVTRRLP